MNFIHWPSVAVGAALYACMIYAVALIVETLRRWMGHHESIFPSGIQPSRTGPQPPSAETLIESARTIIKQGGNCCYPEYIKCPDCPLRLEECLEAGNAVRLAQRYLALHNVTT